MKMYRKKALVIMEPWCPNHLMERVSVSEVDRLNGSPKIGDMIATNPKNPDDVWLVAEQFFHDNYEHA